MDQSELDATADVASMARALSPLAKVNWELRSLPWQYLLLVPTKADENSWRMRSEDRKLSVEAAANLLRWITGVDMLDDGNVEALRESWRSLLYPEPLEQSLVEGLWNEIVALKEKVQAG